MFAITLNREGEASALYNVYWSTTPNIAKTNQSD